MRVFIKYRTYVMAEKKIGYMMMILGGRLLIRVYAYHEIRLMYSGRNGIMMEHDHRFCCCCCWLFWFRLPGLYLQLQYTRAFLVGIN